MRILSISNNQYTYEKPSFKELRREVTGSLFYRNDTWFYRDKAFWRNLVELLDKTFKDVPKVNVYSFGCSDGSEVFTFIMEILSNKKHLKDKFLPVIAKDFDHYMIERIKSKSPYWIKDEEYKDIDYFTNGMHKQFLTYIKDPEKLDPTLPPGRQALINQELYNNAEFSQADIWEDYENIEPNNSIVFVRNFWPYIPQWYDRQKLLKKLASQLNDNSYIVIGEFDLRGTEWMLGSQLADAGFERTSVNYVYKKSTPKTSSPLLF